jgi:small subunit ribosomal protein S4
MARNIDPKCKQCRRAGEKLFLKGERCATVKCAIVKRNYPPGVHGVKGRKKADGFALQLTEKQKAKKQYHMLEKQFRLTFLKARQKGGNTGENFLKLLETRFDNTVYRLGLGVSRPLARQLINHGHFTVNGRMVTIPSCQLKSGDIIKIKPSKARAKIFNQLNERLKNKEIPGWLNLDLSEMSAKVLHQPDLSMLKPNFDVQMIIEYYSK